MRIHSPVLKLSGLYRGHGGRCLDLGAPHLSPLSSVPRVKHVEPLKIVTPTWARFSFLHSQNVVFIKVNLVGIAFRIDSFNLNKAGILVNLASHYSSSGGQSLLHQQIRWVTWCCCRYRYFLLMLRNRIFVAGTTPASALYLNLKVLKVIFYHFQFY